MRPLIGALSAAAAAALLIGPSTASNAPPSRPPPSQLQHPIMPGSDKQTLPVQPPGEENLYSDEKPPPPPIKFKTANPSSHETSSTSQDDSHPPKLQSHVSLADTIGPQRSISSFSSFTRLSSSTSDLLSDFNANTTVLAPLNSAIDALPRKPWESQHDYNTFGSQAYDGSGGQDRANKNIEKFVKAHLVTTSPWKEGEKGKTLLGKEIWWEEREGKRVILPDMVEVEKVASRVKNGELWIVKGVTNYE
ncbi:hypothetical protein QQS21_004747 [Conoideocrella luteorostrata]|uniref:FAS1 domain-containing protein n=1 Tax=Conoideocrella luteorostrata TaxID=1105319 RepID=A0AAJ0CUW2_9HYPO|nr:hypothetical protein QQS21_004747 [Conoideocrella luteorostrata]